MARARGMCAENLDYGPGNPDYEHDDRVQREIDEAMFPSIDFDEPTHTYTVSGLRYPSVTEVVGMLRPESGAPQKLLEYKRQLGKAVHKAIELMERGTLNVDTVDPAIVPFVGAWSKFKAETDFSVLHSEMIVYSKKIRVAGTLDLTGMRGKFIELLDLKAVWEMGDETAIQTAGYAMLYQEMTGVKVDRRGGLQLLANGNYSYYPYKDVNDKNVFMACLSVHNWKALHQ